MRFKIGDFLRHKARPEWGVGKVVDVDSENIEIVFSGEGTKTLKASFAEPHLERADASEFVAALPRKSAAKVGRSAPCQACEQPLNRSQRREDGNWKSCPKCSVKDGGEHIYYPYPGAFGESEKRASNEDPSGAQSYCEACRGRGAPSSKVRRCSQFIVVAGG